MNDPRKTDRRQTGDTTSLTSSLRERIARAQGEMHADEAERARSQNSMSGMGRGLRLGSEFVAAILVGLGIGWVLDTWLHTSPWLMLVMLLFGFAAGVLNVIRAAAEMNKAAANPPTVASSVPYEDEKDD